MYCHINIGSINDFPTQMFFTLDRGSVTSLVVPLPPTEGRFVYFPVRPHWEMLCWSAWASPDMSRGDKDLVGRGGKRREMI